MTRGETGRDSSYAHKTVVRLTEMDDSDTGVVADDPEFDDDANDITGVARSYTANHSLNTADNHGREGMNVLYMSGHVKWETATGGSLAAISDEIIGIRDAD